jgi:hypothetical protein
MKFKLVLAAALIAVTTTPVRAEYIPPNHGGPDGTVGSGTRLSVCNPRVNKCGSRRGA